ncbi:MAG: serine hydrolase domain-containing protein [Clostridia bacterium]
MTLLMHRFPSPPDAQVTLANWRTAPFNRWAFHHVREIVPSAEIANDPAGVAPLEGSARSHPALDALFDETGTDGLLVLRHGRLAYERYANGMTPESPHILMSVTKSMLGLLAGILEARGILRLEAKVTSILPELAGSAYEDATVRQLLDMRAGIAFDEDYLATSGPIVEYRKATGWNPLAPGDTPSDLRAFLPSLRTKEGAHGGPFKYTSPNTDLLGWAIERAAGRRYADLMSELLWKPLGAERSAYITVDRLGAPRCAGGMCVTLRDLARVGRLVLEQGSRGAREIVPARWIADLESGGDPKAWSAGNLVEHFGPRPMRYRSKWYLIEEPAKPKVLFGWGIHGQHVFIDRANGLVVAKLSSQAQPIDAPAMRRTLDLVLRLASELG